MAGLGAFFDKVVEKCPNNLSNLLSSWFLRRMVSLDAAKSQQLVESGRLHFLNLILEENIRAIGMLLVEEDVSIF